MELEQTLSVFPRRERWQRGWPPIPLGISPKLVQKKPVQALCVYLRDSPGRVFRSKKTLLIRLEETDCAYW